MDASAAIGLVDGGVDFTDHVCETRTTDCATRWGRLRQLKVTGLAIPSTTPPVLRCQRDLGRQTHEGSCCTAGVARAPTSPHQLSVTRQSDDRSRSIVHQKREQTYNLSGDGLMD